MERPQPTSFEPDSLGRRWFLTTIAGAVLVASAAVEAQQPGKVFRIGYVWAGAPGSDSSTIEGLRQGLRDLGYLEGQNIVIESRFAGGNIDRLPLLIAELTNLKVDVLITPGTPATAAARGATMTTPVVFAAGDPVGSGFVRSLSQPGGNMTGISFGLGEKFSGKWLELVKETVPKAARVSIIWNPANRNSAAHVKEMETLASGLGLRLVSHTVQSTSDIDGAFRLAAREGVGACIVDTDPLTLTHGAQIVKLAAANRLPTVYGLRDFVDAGGLMSYGPNVFALWRHAATYVDKILKGAKPGDLPVEQPTKFELVINLKTAKALGLTIPQSLLLRADEVIHP